MNKNKEATAIDGPVSPAQKIENMNKALAVANEAWAKLNALGVKNVSVCYVVEEIAVNIQY
jgi:hypothetical protein